MKDSGKFMIAIGMAPVLFLLGFLGYREVSGERKSVNEGGIKKGENYDKASVELGKTENVDDDSDLNSVLLSGSENIRESFKRIITRMITVDREKYSMCRDLESFRHEFVSRVMMIFLTNREVIERIPKSLKSFEKFLEKEGLRTQVLSYLNFNIEGETKRISAPDKSIRSRNRGNRVGFLGSIMPVKKPLGEFTLSVVRGGGDQ